MNEPERDAGWQATSDELIAGLCHELNGRISALAGILQLAALDGLVDGGVGRELEAELERLERLSGLLHHLAADRGAGAEPIRPAELLPIAGALLRRHRELGGVELEIARETDAPPVLAGWAPLLRLLVLLLAHTAGIALRLGTARILAGLRQVDDAVLLTLRPMADEPRSPDAPGTALDAATAAEPGAAADSAAAGAGRGDDAELAAELHARAAALGGTLTAGAQDRPGLTLRLPAWNG